MMKITYGNLIALKKAAVIAIADPDTFANETLRLKALHSYVDFFNDFREEASDNEIDMLTINDYAVAYSSLWEVFLSWK